ncbi:Hypothetical protein A7982_03818 [Minicystis rosea]|nr:Hypothetical protein A7982_03818 [Minicystis rosea]
MPPQAGAYPYPYPPPYPYAYPYAYPYGYPYPYPYPYGEQPKYRNNGMRVAGIVLTSFASALMAAGLITMAIDLGGGSGEWRGLVTLVLGVPLMGGSTIFAGIGIPLWMVGGRPPEGAAPPTSAASLGIGPGGLALRF